MKNDNENFKNIFKKRLYIFVLKLINLLDSLNRKDRVSQIINDQLIRSGTSILSNYIEAQASSSKKEFTLFFHHSLKSANESKVWLALLRDSGRTTNDQVKWYLDELKEISNIFGSSILKLKNKK